MDSCLLSQLKPDSPAQQWLPRFWATHEKEDCDALLWGLLSSALSAPPLSTQHSPANLLYLSEQLSLLLCCTHELYAPKPIAPSGCFFLSPNSPPELKLILTTFVSLVEVDQIFLLGSYDAAPTYDLLIILSKPPVSSLPELQSKLTNACEKYGGVTLSLYTSLEIKKLLLSHSLFFQRLFSSSSPVYESLLATTFLIPPDSPSLLTKARKIFHLYQAKAQGFLQSARFSFQAGLFSQALFLMHQATEQALHALFASLTGKRLSSHNLPYLLRLSRRFSPLLYEVFEDEQALLKTLQKAYVAARYDPTFCVSHEDTSTLLRRVEETLSRLPNAFESYLNS